MRSAAALTPGAAAASPPRGHGYVDGRPGGGRDLGASHVEHSAGPTFRRRWGNARRSNRLYRPGKRRPRGGSQDSLRLAWNHHVAPATRVAVRAPSSRATLRVAAIERHGPRFGGGAQGSCCDSGRRRPATRGEHAASSRLARAQRFVPRAAAAAESSRVLRGCPSSPWLQGPSSGEPSARRESVGMQIPRCPAAPLPGAGSRALSRLQRSRGAHFPVAQARLRATPGNVAPRWERLQLDSRCPLLQGQLPSS
mmetsp:Transcript_25757/g.96980  ORF Transcript_25757/g.96980 Transcript_25757/m.96980 type:complete len:253 (-) Transcript_25757:485-1243(-)